MIWLVIATVAAPIVALIFADWWRERRRAAKLDKGAGGEP